MPGICGVSWCSNAPTADTNALARDMMAQLVAASATVRGQWAGDHCALGAVGTSTADGVAHHDDVVLAVTGELSDMQRYWNELPEERRPPSPAAVAHVLLQRYLASGIDGLLCLNGMYAIALWDGRGRTLYLLTDRAAFRKLCYWQNGEHLYFGTRYGAFTSLPQFPAKLDAEGIHEFCRYSFLLGPNTFFQGVKVVEPGTLLTWREGKLTSRKYWDYTFTSEYTDIGDAAAALGTAVRNAIARRADESIYLQMTGGLDSRAIGGYLREVKPVGDTEAITVGMPESIEITYARRLARDLGYPHTPFHLDTSSHARHAEEAVRRTEGMVLNHTGWRLVPDMWVADKGFETATNGFFANVARSGGLSVSMDQHLTREASLKIAYEMIRDLKDEWPLDRVMRPNVYKDVADAPDQYLAAMARNAPAEAEVRLHDYIDFKCRQRGFLGMNLEYFRPRTRILAPLTDNEFVDVALKMGPIARKGSAAYERMIREFLPKACRAPYVRTHLPLRASPAEMLIRRAWGRVMYKVLPSVTRGRIGTRNRASYVPYKGALTRGSKSFFLDNLVHLEGFADILDVPFLRDEMHAYCNDQRPGYGPAYIINTLCLWHKVFVEGRTTAQGV